MEASGSSDDVTRRAQRFILGIMEHYDGTGINKLDRAEEFVDSLLFKTSEGKNNLFSTEDWHSYNVAFVSKYIVIPMIRQRMTNRAESDPFSIHDWN